MRLVLIRHAETVENAKGIVQGQLSGRLSNKGIEQAKATAELLKNERFDAVYSSDLGRARETTSIIMRDRPDQAVITERRLREQSFGVYEGKPILEMLKRMKRERADFTTFAPRGGENPAAFCLRVIKLYEELKGKHRADNVLLVTHNGVINVLLGLLVYDNSEAALDRITSNGSITILTIDDSDVVTVETENNTDHLRTI